MTKTTTFNWKATVAAHRANAARPAWARSVAAERAAATRKANAAAKAAAAPALKSAR